MTPHLSRILCGSKTRPHSLPPEACLRFWPPCRWPDVGLAQNPPAFVEENSLEIHFQSLRVAGFGQRFFSVIFRSLTNWKSAWLKFCIPSSIPVSTAAGNLSSRFSSINLRTVPVLIMISGPGSLLQRRC